MSKIFFVGGVFLLMFFSCKENDRLPDDARTPIPVVIERFDDKFFALDTLQLDAGLHVLANTYPDFFPAYLSAVLGINPTDPLAGKAIRAFIGSYGTVYQTAGRATEKALSVLPSQLEDALQRFRYHVPSFRPDSPFVVTTFIGPMDAFESFSVGDYGDVRTNNGVGIALQLHLGADASVYEEGMQAGLFFQYQVTRFHPQTILVNAMKTVVDDHFPYQASGKPLVEEMIEKGKRIYLLKRIMPQVHDSLILGYTGDQLKGCFENESLIWNFFVKNDLLYSIEPSVNQQYIRDGPKTPELGESSPGYIGLFAGWRIVDAYLKKHPDITVDALMQKPANEIFQGSGYRPRGG
jgi:hypothetical protein